MKKLLKWIGIIIIASLLIGIAGFFTWALTPSQPATSALAALKSDSAVTVTDNGKYITFQPTGQTPGTGFIFYPGGHVDYRAYSPILRQIAERGYLVVLLPVRLNLAFFDIDAGAPILNDFPTVQTWATGGHSLGGVAAALFAPKHPQLKGLVFWASYPADEQLKKAGLKVLSIYGTEDGGLKNGSVIEEKKALLPDNTAYVVIQGGNHGQFGDYGPQPGDHPATISPEQQWQQVTDATVQFLASLR